MNAQAVQLHELYRKFNDIKAGLAKELNHLDMLRMNAYNTHGGGPLSTQASLLHQSLAALLNPTARFNPNWSDPSLPAPKPDSRVATRCITETPQEPVKECNPFHDNHIECPLCQSERNSPKK